MDGTGLRQLTTVGGITSGLDVGFAAGSVPEALVITSSSPLSDGTVGSAYSQTLVATGGTAPYTWAVVSGGLPAGLTLGAAGVISGKPTAEGAYGFTVRVRDSEEQSATKALSLTVGRAGRQQLTFNRDGDVWMMNIDGTDLRQVTHVGDVQGTTRLSDNGVLLYCAGSRLFVARSDASSAHEVKNVNDPSYEFELSPDGAQLVFGEGPSTHFNIFAINADGTGRRTVRGGGNYHQMANGWGKDGFVYFVECVYGDPYTQHVLRVPQAGGAPETLVSYFSQTPSVSSGSGRVLFLYNQPAPRLRVMNADGSGQTDIPNTPQGVGLFPALSADGSTAFYVYKGNIWSVAVDGTGLRQLTTVGGITSGLDVGFISDVEKPVENMTTSSGVTFGMPLPVSFFSATKVTVKGLPSGLKYNPATKTIEGVPTKAGTYDVEISAEGVDVQKMTLTVTALPAWAQGTFNGYVQGGGLASMTVSAAGKVSGKISLAGTNYTFSSASYSRSDADGSTFWVKAQAKSGRTVQPLELSVSRPILAAVWAGFPVPGDLSVAESADGWLSGGQGSGPALFMWRDVWRDADMVSVPLGYAGYYTATLPGNEAVGSGYLTLTADMAGKVKTAGKLADGTPVSLAGTLVVDDMGRVFAVLYTSPAVYKGGSFYGLAEFVEPADGGYKFLRLRDGGPALWQSRSPQATETYGRGFTREPVLTGGWYSKTDNLYDYYEGDDLTARTDQEAAAPALTVGANRYSSICWDPSGVVLSPVLKSGVMTGLTAPPADKPTDPDKDGVWDYGAANSVGLKIALTRPTGIFKGSFNAWFDYPEKKHVSKSLAFEGVLTPVREDPSDGTEGRGFFLCPDKVALPGVAKTYAFNWSYDFTLANQIGSPSPGDFTGIWLATPTQGDNTKVSFWQEGNDIWMGVEKGTVSGQNFSIDIPYREPKDDDEWVIVGVTGKMEDGVIKGTVKNKNAFSGAFSTTSYTATKLSTGSMSAAGNFNNRSGFDRSGEAVGYIDDEGDLKLFMSGGKEFVAEFEVEYPPKGQLTTGQLLVSQGYEFELTCAMPGYPDLDLDEPATSGWVNLTRCDTRVVGTYDVYFRGGDWHVSGSFDVPCTLALDQ